MTANPNCLGSVCEEIQCQVAECGIQAQSAKFHGGDCIEC